MRACVAIILSVLYFVEVQASTSKQKRDISELLQKKQNLFNFPNYNTNPGYDYPRPGNDQGPLFRDPEPTYIETRPIYRDQEPVWVRPRPVEPNWVQTRPVEQSWVQTRPQIVGPSYIVRPIYPETSTITRPIYRPQQGVNQPSEKLFWPLIQKVATAFNPNYYPGGTNSIGFPTNPNGPNFPSNPGNFPSFPNKFSFLGNLFPGFSKPYGGYPTNNFQRMEYPAPRPVITSTTNTEFAQRPVVIANPGNTGVIQNPAVYPVYQPGVNTIGDSVTVDAAISSDGYDYPKPNEQLPPLDLPNSIQFRAEPKKDEDIN